MAEYSPRTLLNQAHQSWQEWRQLPVEQRRTSVYTVAGSLAAVGACMAIDSTPYALHDAVGLVVTGSGVGLALDARVGWSPLCRDNSPDSPELSTEAVSTLDD